MTNTPADFAPTFATGLSNADKAKSAERQAALAAECEAYREELRKRLAGKPRPRVGRYEAARHAGWAGR